MPRDQNNPTEHKTFRLAESSVASVDQCNCGVFKLNLGALTLRISPDAAAELASTLKTALHEHARIEATMANRSPFGPVHWVDA